MRQATGLRSVVAVVTIAGLTGLMAGTARAGPLFAVSGGIAGPARFVVGSALTVSALGFALWVYFSGRAAMRRGRRARRAADWAPAILGSAPIAFLSWSSDGAFAASPRLLTWLNRQANLTAFNDLFDGRGRTGFAEADFARLEEAVAAARAGTPLPPPFEVAAAGRQFRVSADRRDPTPDSGSAPGSLGPLFLLWFTDITAERDELAACERQIATLEAEKRTFEDMLNALDFPVWRQGGDLQLTWVNDAYIHAVEGRDRTEVVAANTEFAPNLLTGGSRNDAVRARASGAVVRAKHYAVVGGQRRALGIVNIPVELGADGAAAVTSYAIDRTELEEMRAQFSRYTDSHAETLNKLSTAVAIFGADKTLEFHNSAFARLWQLPEDWLASHPPYGELLEAMRERRLLPEQADFPAWKRARLDRYADLLEPFEEMWHLPDGSALRVVVQPHPLGGLLMFYEDVTDRLALERSYNTLIAVQRATLNNLHEGVAAFGGDGRLRLHNPAFSAIWKLAEPALAEQPHLADIVAWCETLFASADEFENFRRLLFQDDGVRVVRNGRLQRADESEIDFTAVPLPDGATLFTFIDVTDSVRIERALRERNEALEAADRLKSEFVAHISYELRTPLNNVVGFAELLDKEYYGPLNAQQHTYTNNILDASAQLMVLINDIIDLSVIEAGGMKIEPGAVDVDKTLRSVATMVGDDIAKREQTLDLAVPPDIGSVEADERRLRQVLYNLVSNAMKFTPPHGRITLGAESVGADGIKFYVADTGVGIQPDEQEQVFARFYTGRNVPRGLGAGLGLSLVRSFVELHSGSVTLTSEPERGTTVVCSLPRRQPVPRCAG